MIVLDSVAGLIGLLRRPYRAGFFSAPFPRAHALGFPASPLSGLATVLNRGEPALTGIAVTIKHEDVKGQQFSLRLLCFWFLVFLASATILQQFFS